MQHQTIFTEKDLELPLAAYDIQREVSDFEDKKKVIENWIAQIQSGRIDSQKEEALQADFLNRIFGDVLAYDYRNPDKWLLEKELKTPIDGTKTDGGLGYFRMVEGKKDFADVRVAIELKDGRTNLDKKQNRKGDNRTPVAQGFGYASKFGEACKWVIISNFKEIRLYNKELGQTRYESWNITELTNEKHLKRFFLLLHRDRLFWEKSKSPVLHLFEQRQAEEARISKAFYTDYKESRLSLFAHLRTENPDIGELTLFSKAQKLLDRVLFVCFCEDYNIIPYFTFRKLLESIKSNVFDASDDKIYRGVKNLFTSIEKGNPAANINRFNGGLFAPDDTLDNLIIKDKILEPVILLSEYNFATELNVNILGHIFEQSISDIEEIKAQIQGEDFDKEKGKRKKDGIFYTPEYITRYIVEQAVGGWLDDRKTELGEDTLPELSNDDYATIKVTKKGKITANTRIKKHIEFWEKYIEKLRSIKVIDPACGSGAFLNQVFDFLYNEGQTANTELAKLKGGQRDIFDLDKHILSNNIYGVDLNTESVQITKLSLWLKTANKQSELTALDQNIQVGNSLIDDTDIAGDLAFKWEERFKNIFDKGGFDVVVGNPPYGAELAEAVKQHLLNRYETFEYQVNTYVLFYEKGINILNSNGLLGYITPATFTYQYYFGKLRTFLNQFKQIAIVKYAYEVFEDAEIGDSVSWIIQKTNNDKSDIYVQICFNEQDEPIISRFKTYDELLSDDGIYLLNGNSLDVNRFRDAEKLGDIAHIIVGIKPYQRGKGEPKQTAETVKQKIFTSSEKINDTYLPCVIGKDFHRYGFMRDVEMYLSYGKWLAEPRASAPFFDNEKIILRQTADRPLGTIDNQKRINLNNVYNVGLISDKFKLRYLLALLNSKLFKIIYRNTAQEKGRLFAEVKKVYLAKLPIIAADENIQIQFEEKVNMVLNNSEELHKLSTRFLRRLRSNFEQLDKVSKKLNRFWEYDFKTLLAELKKKKVPKLKLSEQDEWEEYFDQYKADIQALKSEIDHTDAEIDRMVYALYGLTDEEIKIVEESV